LVYSKQNKTKQNKTKQNKTKQNKTRPEKKIIYENYGAKGNPGLRSELGS